MKKLILIGCMFLTSVFAENNFEQEFQKSLKELKQLMPYQISEYVTWENIDKKENLVIYTFQLKQPEFKGFSKSEAEGIVKKQCRNQTTKLILSNNYSLKINYKNYQGNVIQDFVIDSKTCENILSKEKE